MKVFDRVDDILSRGNAKFLFTAFYAFWADNLTLWLIRLIFRGSADDYFDDSFLNGDDSKIHVAEMGSIKERAFFLMRLIPATFIYLVVFKMGDCVSTVTDKVDSFLNKSFFKTDDENDRIKISVLYVSFFTVFSFMYAIAFISFGTVIDHWGTFCTLSIGLFLISFIHGFWECDRTDPRMKAFGFFVYFISSTILLFYPFLYDAPKQSTFIEIAPTLITFFGCILTVFVCAMIHYLYSDKFAI